MQILPQSFNSQVDTGQANQGPVAGSAAHNGDGSFKKILKTNSETQDSQQDVPIQTDKETQVFDKKNPNGQGDKDGSVKNTKDTVAYIAAFNLSIIPVQPKTQEAVSTGGGATTPTSSKTRSNMVTGVALATQQAIQLETKKDGLINGQVSPAIKMQGTKILGQPAPQPLLTEAQEEGPVSGKPLNIEPDALPFNKGIGNGPHGQSGEEIADINQKGWDKKQPDIGHAGTTDTDLQEKSAVYGNLDTATDIETTNSNPKNTGIDNISDQQKLTQAQTTGQSGIKETIQNSTEPIDKMEGQSAGPSGPEAGAAGVAKQANDAAKSTVDVQNMIPTAQDPKKTQPGEAPKKENAAGPVSTFAANRETSAKDVETVYSANQQDGAGNKGDSSPAEKTGPLPDNPKSAKNEDQTPDVRFAPAGLNNTSDRIYSDNKSGNADLIEKRDIVQGLKDQVLTSLSVGDKRAVIHLDPPELGRISVQLTLTNNHELKATFVADHPDVRNIIRGNMDGLKDHLDQKGFNVTRLAVEGGTQTDASFLGQRNQGHTSNWTNEFIKQPFMNGSIVQDGTEGIMTETAFAPRNGRVNLVI